MATNAEIQAAFKAKMRQAGKQQIAIWVTPEQKAAIKVYLESGDRLLVMTPPVPLLPFPSSPIISGKAKKKKRDTREAWQIRNDELWQAHRDEVRRRIAMGQKPSEVATWLNTLGFTGSGATLNGYIKGDFTSGDRQIPRA